MSSDAKKCFEDYVLVLELMFKEIGDRACDLRFHINLLLSTGKAYFFNADLLFLGLYFNTRMIQLRIVYYLPTIRCS